MSTAALTAVLDSVDFDDEHFDRQYVLERLHESAEALVRQIAARLVAVEDRDNALRRDRRSLSAGYDDAHLDGELETWREAYQLLTGSEASGRALLAEARSRVVAS